MRNLSWLVAVAAVAVLGWFVFAPSEQEATSAPAEAVTIEPLEEAEETADTAETEAEEAVEEVEATVMDAK